MLQTRAQQARCQRSDRERICILSVPWFLDTLSQESISIRHRVALNNLQPILLQKLLARWQKQAGWRGWELQSLGCCEGTCVWA